METFHNEPSPDSTSSQLYGASCRAMSCLPGFPEITTLVPPLMPGLSALIGLNAAATGEPIVQGWSRWAMPNIIIRPMKTTGPGRVSTGLGN
jgi:hypothetical protein